LKGTKPAFSQSLYKELLNKDSCPLYIRYKYIEGIQTEPSDLMFRGQYFEYHLIGGTRDGNIPLFKPLKRGGDSKVKSDLDDLIGKAKSLLKDLGIIEEPSPENFLVQPEILIDREVAHPDLITKDFQDPKRRALYDVKYTETAVDDRWNGWGDFENSRQGDKFQATHYIKLYFEKYSSWIPFYFLIFGKSGWVRIIKIEVTELGLEIYTNDVARAKELYKMHNKNNWPAEPAFNKCQACPYASICPAAARLPEIETFQI
jgi:hypothetical protein